MTEEEHKRAGCKQCVFGRTDSCKNVKDWKVNKTMEFDFLRWWFRLKDSFIENVSSQQTKANRREEFKNIVEWRNLLAGEWKSLQWNWET